MKKKLLALLLAIGLCLSLVACSADKGGEGEETKEEVTEKKKISYGTSAINFGDISIKAGQTVKDLCDKGISIESNVLSTTLAPRAHTTVAAVFEVDSNLVDTVHLGIINAGEADAKLSDCTVYRITATGNEKNSVSLKNGIKPGISSAEDIKKAYDSKYLIDDKTYGTNFNHIKFTTDSNGIIIDVTVIYLSSVLKKADPGDAKVDAAKLTDLSILAQFTDVSAFPKNEYKDLSVVLGTTGLKFLLEGKEIVLGKNGENHASLTEKGFDIALDGTLKANTGTTSNKDLTFGDKVATAPVFRNYTDAEVALTEAKLCGITLKNEAYSTDEKIDMDFNIYGITQSSKAADIISRFGVPESTLTNLSALKTSLLYYCTAEDTKYFISITIDSLSGEIASVTISGYGQ